MTGPAPISFTADAASRDRVSANTSCWFDLSRRTSGRPIAPLAPAIRILIALPISPPLSSDGRFSLASSEDLLHVAIGGGGRLLRRAAALTRAQGGRLPGPPVVLRMRRLVAVVVLGRFVEELGEGRDVHGSCSLLLPLAAG